MTNKLAGLLLITLVAGCAGPAVTLSPTVEVPAPGYITRAEYGSDWPFTVPAGTLYCYPGTGSDADRLYVTFGTGDGIEYGLNGSARDFGWPELDDTILIDYPDRSGTIDLIERGLALCD